MDASCSLCGYDGDMQPLYPRQQVVRCPRCRLAFYAGRVDPAKLYTPEYFRGAEYRDYVGDRRLIQKDFARRIRALRKLKPGGRLLEIGCAFGFFLDLAREHWEARGLDVVDECVRYAREELGVAAEAGEFTDD